MNDNKDCVTKLVSTVSNWETLSLSWPSEVSYRTCHRINSPENEEAGAPKSHLHPSLFEGCPMEINSHISQLCKPIGKWPFLGGNRIASCGTLANTYGYPSGGPRRCDTGPHKCLLQHFIDTWKWRPEEIDKRVEHDLDNRT